MNSPEYPPVKELCETIKTAAFRVKTRGYDPKEVDAFLEVLIERLNNIDGKLVELQRYESWLRMEAHGQIIGQSQQEALRIMQEAQDKARALEESSHAEAKRQQEELHATIQQYTDSWNEQKEILEKEMETLRQNIKEYRDQAAHTMETCLNALREDSQRDVSAHATMPSISTATVGSQVSSMDDVSKLIEDLKRQLR